MRRDVILKILNENFACSMGTFYNISNNENIKDNNSSKMAKYNNLKNILNKRKQFILREML